MCFTIKKKAVFYTIFGLLLLSSFFKYLDVIIYNRDEATGFDFVMLPAVAIGFIYFFMQAFIHYKKL